MSRGYRGFLNNSYDVILAPVVTEKSTSLGEFNQFVFRVPLSVTKSQVRSAVEEIFSVRVVSVNTLRSKGKVKRFKGVKGKRLDFKRAVVRLAQGDSIDAAAGV